MIKTNQTKLKQTELGLIPHDWEVFNFGNVASFSQGLQVGVENQYLDRKDGYFRFVRIVDYTNNGDWSPRYVKTNQPEKYWINHDDLAMIRYGSQTAGKIITGFEGIIANNLFRINCSGKIFKKFLYYYLNQNEIYHMLNDFQSSSTMPAITFGQLSILPIPIPSLSEQQKIAGVLGVLDEKIELNRKMNKTIESIGQAIFKKWFVDNPKKEDWRIEPLEKISDLISRGPSLKYTEKSGIPVLNQRCVRNSEIELEAVQYAEKLSENKDHLYLRINDILINSMGEGTLGRISRNLSIGYRMIIHNCITAIRANEKIISQHLLYYQLKNLENELTSMGSGTTGQTSLKPEIIKNIKIFIPEKKLIRIFDDQISNIWKLIGKNKKQIEILSQIRDSLLPRLMNGRLSVI